MIPRLVTYEVVDQDGEIVVKGTFLCETSRIESEESLRRTVRKWKEIVAEQALQMVGVSLKASDIVQIMSVSSFEERRV